MTKLAFYTTVLCLMLVACDHKPLNSPHPPQEEKGNIFYSYFGEHPKTLDPARSYSVEETVFTAQIYEPPLQYHYLKRPYELIPLTASTMPTITYLDKQSNPLADPLSDADIAYSVYDIKIKPGVFYAPHPAFVKNDKDKFLYQNLSLEEIKNIKKLSDFEKTDTREVTAYDYVYQIKRLASPKLQSPILGFMTQHLLDLKTYSESLSATYKQKDGQDCFFDLREYPFTGAKVLDRYHYQVIIKGKYPQFMYWLAMPFFAPIPWEADSFYSQPGMKEQNITFDWYPVGTGAYWLTKNNPNRQMVLERNPHFREAYYPTEGEAIDESLGLLASAGKRLPFIDKFVFNLEKESIPRWTKFLQGYYDQSGISSDSFDEAIQIDDTGKPELTSSMQDKDINLRTSVEPNIFYVGFNMLDPLVGGSAENNRKLRQALSIVLNYEEYIAIFLNGRGVPAQSPIPEGIFGYKEGKAGINPYVYTWQNGRAVRKSLEEAKRLLREAGYPNGQDAETGKPLVLNYDVAGGSGPDERARFDWMRKQIATLGIQLQVRSTTYNRFRDKMQTGNAQIYFWGWSADYPDPENFLFLLYGPNGKVKHGGENASNYQNERYDALFNQMKNMPNGEARQEVINEMLEIIRYDAPWVFGFHPKSFLLYHDWSQARKPMAMGNNTLKYASLDPSRRKGLRENWNEPHWGALLLLLGTFILVLIPVMIRYWRKERQPAERREKE